jgi:hypothetical protein
MGKKYKLGNCKDGSHRESLFFDRASSGYVHGAVPEPEQPRRRSHLRCTPLTYGNCARCNQVSAAASSKIPVDEVRSATGIRLYLGTLAATRSLATRFHGR